MDIHKIKQELGRINASRSGSAWERGVAYYTGELIDTLTEFGKTGTLDGLLTSDLEKILLNGAASWGAYSWGGCSLINDCDIAEAVCTPSELKRNNNGERRPNKSEGWLDVQARALRQAAARVYRAYRAATTAGVLAE